MSKKVSSESKDENPMKSTRATEPAEKKVSNKKRSFSGKELAEILGIPQSSLFLRAEKEVWPFQEVAVRGGRQKLFLLQASPIDVQRAVRIHTGELPEELAECTPIAWDADKVARCAKLWAAAEPWQQAWAKDRVDILAALNKFRESRPAGTPAATKNTGKRAATDRFAYLYNQRQAPGIDQGLYDRVKRISKSQAYEWERRFEQDGIAGLISLNGQWKKDSTYIPVEQQEFLFATLLQRPNLRPIRLHGLLQSRFPGEAPSETTVRKFVQRQKGRDPALFALIKNPEKYRGSHRLSLGEADERAKRPLHYVEVDSTNGEIMCSDGRRYNVCGLIDQFSRKARFVVTPTSNSWAIAGLVWAVCNEWGIPENLIRDRGKDYASKHISGALERLECNVIELPPRCPELKPHIERVFRTLTGYLFEMLPGYLGHNVAERKRIESQKEFHKQIKEGGKLAVSLSAGELQEIINSWTENVYHQSTHSKLGMSPSAKAASVAHRPRRIEDPQALALLLAPSRDVAIGKKGIRYENGFYWDDPATTETDPGSLCQYDVGRKVRILPDLADAGRIYCFDIEAKAFICQARDMAISGITIGEKIAARKRADKRIKARFKAVKALAETVGDPVAEEINRIRSQRATITNLPTGEPVTDNPFVKAAMQAADAGRDWGRNDRLPGAPPSEPCRRISRTRLSSRWFTPEGTD